MSVHALKQPERPTASIIYIDAPMARRVLERNTRNRTLLESHVQRLMEEMRSGRWQYNGEAIKWSVDNVLLDGQHRLTALSRLDDDFCFPFLVVRGLPAETQDTMDQGRVRSASDQLSIHRITAGGDVTTIAGAARIYIQWMRGGLFGDLKRTRVGNPEIVQWAQSHPIEVSLMQDIIAAGAKRIKCRPSLTVAVLLHFHLIDGECAREFADSLLTGAGLDRGNPILTLRNRLDRNQTEGFKTTDRDLIAVFITAWNAWRAGRTLDRFQRPVGGAWSASNFPVAK